MEAIERLKALTSVPLATGYLVHTVIKDILRRLLKTEIEIDRQRLFDYIEGKIAGYCKAYEFEEVYYSKASKITPDYLFDDVVNRIYVFLDSNAFSFIKDKALGEKGRWIIEPPGYGESRIDGLKAYFKVDFLFPIKDQIFIYDWKTGKEDSIKHSKQLLGYACWAAYQFDTKIELIKPTIVYLGAEYKEKTVELKDDQLASFAQAIRDETNEMYAYCNDVDQNLPKPKSFFQKTDNLTICGYCNFKEFCL